LVFVASSVSLQALRRKSKDWLARNQNNVSKEKEQRLVGSESE